MTLGTRIGVYEVTAKLGAGGMGEVYRALDTKLDRDVALKILPESFASDPDRLMRFEREAKTLASLNHSNIAQIYGIESNALVMELVEGEDLSTRIARGPIPLDEALPIAKQIAEALEAAHDQGIIHRDLKPANIKVRPDGTVKVLDFGLAKALDQGSGIGDQGSGANSATITSPAMTMHGVILGTAAYMSPEQARGKPVDKRADIWAFGCVVFEMLTGQRAFAGDDMTDVLAAVVRAEPEWHRLPADLSPTLMIFLRRCLQKDSRQRIADVHDVRLAIEGAFDTAAPIAARTIAEPPARSIWARAWPYVAAAAAGAAAFALVVNQSGWGQTTPAAAVSRLSIEGVGNFDEIVISRDGSRVLIRLANRLSLRSMDTDEIVPLKLTASAIGNPMFSPDGESVGFTDGLVLKRTTTAGGATVDLATLPGEATGCQWNDDHIYCAVGTKGVFRVATAGGAVEQVIALRPGEVAATPVFVPGAGAVLFTLAPGAERGDWTRSSVVAESLSSHRREVIAEGGSDPHLLPGNQIAYAVEGVWFAVGFDSTSGRAVGVPVPVLEGVDRWIQGGLLQPRAGVDISATGTLVYGRGPLTFGSVGRRVIATDRTGAERVLPIEPKEFESPRVSPDGRQLAISTETANEAAVWIYDLTGGHALRRLTFTGRNRLPVWSPDSRRVAFQSDRGGDRAIFVQAADGSSEAERWTTAAAGTAHIPESWSRDGRYLAFSSVTQNGVELWTRAVATGAAKRFGDVHSNAPLNAAFSPDGKWVAYTLRAAAGTDGPVGRGAIFMEPVPATGAKYQVSTEGVGAHHPFWSPDGKELFYWGRGGGQLLVSAMPEKGPMAPGPPVPVPGNHASNMNALGPLNYDITPDGREFILTRAEQGSASPDTGSLEVVLNWLTEIKLGAKR